MQFIDLATQQKRIRTQIEKRFQTILDHGKYIMGPEIDELEEKLSQFSGVKHTIACASGTDALLMALMALKIGPGDAVFTTPFTFIATAEVIALLGAVPVFVDIDPKTFNIAPDRLDAAITALKSNDPKIYPLPRINIASTLTPKAIIAVDLFGLCADYDAIDAIAKKHGMVVIEDAAQSFGAECHGKKAGTFGDIACTSFFPAKPLGCYGDGGAIQTQNAELDKQMRSIRVHGQGSHKYENIRIGINGRLDTLQAAVLLEKLTIFPEEIERRQTAANRYTQGLKSAQDIQTPVVPVGYKSVWAQYSLLARNAEHRNELIRNLNAKTIPTAIYYPIPLHLQTAFQYLGYRKGDLPVSEISADSIFSLPMHPYLKVDDQESVIRAILGE